MAFLAELERMASARRGPPRPLLAPEPAAAREPAGLAEAMRYAALGGGKRLRPFLLIESARLFGVAEEGAFTPLARSNACIATRSCMTTCRRWTTTPCAAAARRPHIAFGEATAILAGDALLTLAFEILSDRADPSRSRPFAPS